MLFSDRESLRVSRSTEAAGTAGTARFRAACPSFAPNAPRVAIFSAGDRVTEATDPIASWFAVVCAASPPQTADVAFVAVVSSGDRPAQASSVAVAARTSGVRSAQSAEAAFASRTTRMPARSFVRVRRG